MTTNNKRKTEKACAVALAQIIRRRWFQGADNRYRTRKKNKKGKHTNTHLAAPKLYRHATKLTTTGI